MLVFQDDKAPSHLVFVLQEQSRNKNVITTIVEIDNNSKGIEVDAVVSNHGRRNLLEKVSKAIDLDRRIYVNERTGAWLSALVREPAGDIPDAPIPDVARPGETGLPAERLAAIRRLSEEYCRKFPDTEASRELRRAALGSEMEILPAAPWHYLSSALGEVDEDVNVEVLGGDASDFGKSVPWYVREAWERNEMTHELACSSYIAISEGEYGIVHEIEVERGDAFAEVECLGGYNAAETALAEVAGEFAREHPGLECAFIDESPDRPSHISLRTRVTLGVFTPWNMDSAENDRIAQDLCSCYDRVAERSRTIQPPNLIELKGERPEGHMTLTDSSGEPTYMIESGPHGYNLRLAEVIDGRLEDLPDEAQMAWRRQSDGFGPTNYLYEVRTCDERGRTQTTYGNLSEIYMTTNPASNLSHIDRFDEFEAQAEDAHRALEEVAREFAWRNPDVTVLSGAAEYSSWAHTETGRSFEVFTPISVNEERYQEVFWDQDKCFATIERRCREMEAERNAQGIGDMEVVSGEPEPETQTDLAIEYLQNGEFPVTDSNVAAVVEFADERGWDALTDDGFDMPDLEDHEI